MSSVSCSVSVKEEQLSPSGFKDDLRIDKCARTALKLKLLCCFGVQWLIRCSVNFVLEINEYLPSNFTNPILRFWLIY